MPRARQLDLFAGIAVSRFPRSLAWYEQLLGTKPAVLPHATEAVWEVAPHRYVYIVEQQENSGHARVLLFVSDLRSRISGISKRGLKPAKRETVGTGVRKITFLDPDGNEIAFGGRP